MKPVGYSELWELVNRSQKPVFAVFTEPNRPACETYKRFVEEAAKLLGDAVEFVEVDAYSDPRPAWELGIVYTPATVLFHEGKPIDGFIGVANVPNIREFIENAQKQKPRPPSEWLAKHRLRNEMERMRSVYRRVRKIGFDDLSRFMIRRCWKDEEWRIYRVRRECYPYKGYIFCLDSERRKVYVHFFDTDTRCYTIVFLQDRDFEEFSNMLKSLYSFS